VTRTSPSPIRIGVSACLLGDAVRYDGGHKRNAILVALDPFVEWIKVCPEVECGMGTPREAIQLVDQDGRIHLVGVGSGIDHTVTMTSFANRRVAELEQADLCGYVLKSDSPSCGIAGVTIHGAGASESQSVSSGTGLFAAELLARFPNLPIEEDSGLRDAERRGLFIERVCAYRRLRDLFDRRWTTADLIAFHTAHKLVLMAHSPAAYRTLGRWVAAAKSTPQQANAADYTRQLMAALAIAPTRARHVNVLQHVLGYFKPALDDATRAGLAAAIEQYRVGAVALDHPLGRLRACARERDIPYLRNQLYLEPDPREFLMRTGG
jgi:uncharacterized protein YbgA (DUF1722 family)/uncharacterized protein YbbK (DUF523 family)